MIAFCAYGFAQFLTRSVSFKFSDMLLFGAIISATDPVTVLTIFHVIYNSICFIIAINTNYVCIIFPEMTMENYPSSHLNNMNKLKVEH